VDRTAPTYTDVAAAMELASRYGAALTPESAIVLSGVKAPNPPHHAMSSMWAAWVHSPYPSFGLDALRDMHRTEWDEILDMIGVQQDERYHAEGDVFAHTKMVVDAMAGLAPQGKGRTALMLAALLHDAGKADTTMHNGKSWVSPLHQLSSRERAHCFMRKAGIGEMDRVVVDRLVLHHMSWRGLNKERASSLAEALYPATPRQLNLLIRADLEGRIPPGSSDVPERVTHMLEHSRPYLLTKDVVEAMGLDPDDPVVKDAVDISNKLYTDGKITNPAIKLTEVLAWMWSESRW